MLEGAGFQVVDAGVDVAQEKFVELAKAHQADVIGVSALLDTTTDDEHAPASSMAVRASESSPRASRSSSAARL